MQQVEPPPSEGKPSNYRVERLKANHTHQAKCYFIASTAPRNVEDENEPFSTPQNREIIPDFAIALHEIAGHLLASENPRLVIRIHGYSTHTPDYDDSYRIIHDCCDDAGLVFIGYQWPSEARGEPSRNFLPAVPGTLAAASLAALGLLGTAAVLLPFSKTRMAGWAVATAAATVGALPGATFALRTSAYFRDIYRSQAFGVTDLLELIRQLHRSLTETRNSPPDDHNAPEGDLRLPGTLDSPDSKRRFTSAAQGDPPIGLSFIAHSMGALVTTSLIRILTDVFSPATMNPHPDDGARDQKISNRIGRAFQLQRLVMASPDISAETLMTKRANYLAPSLARFDESYLFSNANDTVLKYVSTVANSFSFPTENRNFGWRLGNMEVLAAAGKYGVIAQDESNFAGKLRVGKLTLLELSGKLEPNQRPSTVAELFTYFDCTKYVDTNPDGSPAAPMHDGHGGYFQGAFTSRMMHQLACLGGVKALQSNGIDDRADFDAACSKRRIRVMLSQHRPAGMLPDAPPPVEPETRS